MISFILCCVIIVGGYFTYSKLVENIFGPDDRETVKAKFFCPITAGVA